MPPGAVLPGGWESLPKCQVVVLGQGGFMPVEKDLEGEVWASACQPVEESQPQMDC